MKISGVLKSYCRAKGRPVAVVARWNTPLIFCRHHRRDFLQWGLSCHIDYDHIQHAAASAIVAHVILGSYVVRLPLELLRRCKFKAEGCTVAKLTCNC